MSGPVRASSLALLPQGASLPSEAARSGPVLTARSNIFVKPRYWSKALRIGQAHALSDRLAREAPSPTPTIWGHEPEEGTFATRVMAVNSVSDRGHFSVFRHES